MGMLVATAVTWKVLGKPDLGMSINGLLAGLVAITPACAYVSIPVSYLIGAIAGILIVFAAINFEKMKLDDPVGAMAVHLANGVFGTLSVGLFAQEGVTGLSIANGLFYGGGIKLLGVQALGAVCVGAFVLLTTAITWLVIKKTIGLRVSLKEEIEGLDIGEHGNQAYPEFVIRKTPYTYQSEDIEAVSMASSTSQKITASQGR
jgi:Amt family ammonium transporter